MKLILYIGCLLLIHTVGFSQLEKPISGKPYSTARKENFNGFIGENSTTLFSIDYLYLNRKKQELIVRKFHKSDLLLVDSKNIYENPPEGFYGEPIEVFYQNDTIYMFSNMYDEKEKITLIKLELFNSLCDKIGENIVDTLADNANLFFQKEAFGKGFLLAKSNKYSNLTEQEVALKYIDNSGAIVWNKKIKSPMALQNLQIEKIRFTEEGPIYLLCNYAFPQDNQILADNKNMISNKYAIWAYDRDKKFLKEIEIRLKGKWVNGIQMDLNAQQQLVLGGFFNETRYNTVAGVFSLIVNSKLQIVQSSYFKFDEGILQRFIEEKDKGKTKELEDYSLNHLVMSNNGSYFLLGERYYKYVERNYDPRTNITTTTEHYNYNSIVVSYFDSLGKHVWTNRIPKFQNSTNDYGYFSSYTYLNSGSDIYLFFNDTDKNNELALDDYFNYKGLFNNRRSQISFVQINASGPVARGSIVGLENSFLLRAKESKPISSSRIYLQCEIGREAKVFSVELKSN